MTMRWWRLLPLLLFVALAWFLGRGLSLDPQRLPSVRVGQAMPDVSWPVLEAQAAPLRSSSWKGQAVLLNVWASWCAACAEENLFLLRLAHEGWPIYGLNYKDQPSAARAWLSEWGNPYRSVAVDASGQTALELGVYGAPETFLIDAAGVSRYRHAGPLTEAVWRQEFLPLIARTA